VIVSYEVGAVFKIINEASPALTRILRQVRELTAALDKARASMAEITKGLGTGKALTGAIGETDKLAASWANVAKNATEARAAMGRAGSGGLLPGCAGRLPAPNTAGGSGGGNRGLMRPGARGGGHGGGAHVSSIGTRIPGGHMNFRGGGNAGLVAGGLMADAIYQGAELEKESFLSWWHSGLADTPGSMKMIRSLIQESSSVSGFNFKQVGEAAEDIFRLMKGTPDNGLGIAPELLRAGATESLIKGTGLKESTKSIIEMAHMMGIYDPEQLKQMAPVIGFLSTANPASLPQFARSASYSIPTLTNALGINAADVLFENTAIARAGATGSKSGTWVEHAFDRALPPDPHTMGDKTYARRMWSMRKAGLVDAAGNSTILGDDGKIDVEKFLTTAREHLDRLPIGMRNSVEKGVFGEQGARGFELMSKPTNMEQTRRLKAEMPDFRAKYNAFLEQYNERSTVQKARTTYAEFNNLLADIGDKILPGVNKALGDFRDVLATIKGVLPGGKGGATVIARGLEGALAGAAVGTFVPGIGTIAGGVGGGVLGLAEGYMEQNRGQAAPGKTGNFMGQYGNQPDPSYLPSKDGKPAEPKELQQNTTLQLNIDGRTLGEVVASKLVDLMKFDTSSPAFNGTSMLGP
jgi:hypothetical protein